MEAKAPSSAYYSHTETRLSYDNAETRIVSFQLPSIGPFTKFKPVRKGLITIPNSSSEEQYKQRRVATASGVHFRSKEKFPRAISWRLLENSTVLEVRSLDLSKSRSAPKGADANIVFRFTFGGPVTTYCLDIADSEEEDCISIFAITLKRHLHTIKLKSDFFYKVSASEDDPDRWIKLALPVSFRVSTPFRVHALKSKEMIVALTDARLLRLRDDGSGPEFWHETPFDPNSIGRTLLQTMRLTLPGRQMYHGEDAINFDTALNTVVSPDSSHIFTVCGDHKLRIWNIENRNVTIRRDIQDIERAPQDVPNVLIRTSTRKVLDLFSCGSNIDGDLYYAITFSPFSDGIFKIWGIRDANNAEFGLRDMFPEDKLRAPEPVDGAFWMMDDFQIYSNPESSSVDVWLLMRLNQRHVVYKRHFTDLQTIGEEWSSGWSITAVELGKKGSWREIAFDPYGVHAEGTAEAWLEHLMAPGRYTEATLETALTIFREGHRIQTSKNARLGLRDRIASTVGAQLHLSITSPDSALATFHEQVSQEWISFGKIVNDISASHWDTLALEFDRVEETPYIVFGNGFSAVRELSEIESLAFNTPSALEMNQSNSLMQSIEEDGTTTASWSMDHLSAVVQAAARFRSQFSASLTASTYNALQNELWQTTSLAIPERISAFYDECDFESEIGDRVYNGIAASLKSYDGLKAIREDVILGIVGQLMAELPSQSEERGATDLVTRFGTGLVVQGVSDMIAIQERVLTDLLFLIIFLSIEADPEDLPEEYLNVNEVYKRLLEDLREILVVKWLASHSVSTDGPDTAFSAGMTPNHPTNISILEQDFVTDLNPRTTAGSTRAAALTQSIRDVKTYVCGNNEVSLDEALVNIQCNFLKRKEVSLASSCLQFQPSTSWSTYVKGRLYLLRQEFAEAAMCFKQAAFKLARTTAQKDSYHLKSSGFIKADEEGSFGSGFASYYSHIADLFTRQGAHSHVVSITELALQHDDGKDAVQRSNILARLFHSSIAVTDFPIAYAALSRYTDSRLQQASLKELVTKMVSNGYVKELLALPLTTLKTGVEEILYQKAAEEVNLPITATATIPYFRILYAFHIRHKNFRAASSVLVSRLEARHEKRTNNAKQHRFLNSKQESEKALDEYLVGINALALLAPDDDDKSGNEDDAWVFSEDQSGTPSDQKKRRVMRIEGLRERYQAEMDRIGAIELGRWGIINDEEEEDGMHDVEANGTS